MDNYDINEVLKNIFNDENANWKPSDKILLITKEIDKIKSELETIVNDTSLDLPALMEECEELYSQSQTLIDDMNACKTSIEGDIMVEIRNLRECHSKILKEKCFVDYTLNIVSDAVQCGKYIDGYQEGISDEMFENAMEDVINLQQIIDAPADGFEHTDFYTNAKSNAKFLMEQFNRALCAQFDKLIVYKATPENNGAFMVLHIRNDKYCHNIIKALHKNKNLDKKISDFAQFILNEILYKFVHYTCDFTTEMPETFGMRIINNNTPSYKSVLVNVKELMSYLNMFLDFNYHTTSSLMSGIGKMIGQEFSTMLINDCLVNTVPHTIDDLHEYDKITSDIEKYQRYFKNCHFFHGSVSIMRYLDNIDILFSSKATEYFLNAARQIMLKDLSQSMSIGVEQITYEPHIGIDESLHSFDKTIPTSLFYFPRCMISKSTQELLDLVHVMMEQAVQCSDVVCKKHYIATRLVFELYDAVVPYHHEKFLQTIPQYVALFHNNCMYLAHNLLTFGSKWHHLLAERQEELDYSICYLDLVQKLRDLGYKHLGIHMQQQRKQILDNIRSSDLNCIVVKDVLGENAEAAIRQCLRQLQLLKNVWIGVFPLNVFTKLMSTLVNMLFEELIHRVCTVEDISMEMATQLTEMYTLVVQKSPHLFQNQSDVEVNVKTWVKLQELIYVLSGSLRDIEAHWQDGKGPLAQHFRPEELRNLIKALFQNTQIRANLLSKIQ